MKSRIIFYSSLFVGEIYVHGRDVSVGCLAMGDAAIEEIFTLAPACTSGSQRRCRAELTARFPSS